MNLVVLMGRLTKDPEVRYTQGEKPMAIARFTLAVDREVKRDNAQATADFVSCIAFDKTAEFIEKYFKKGRKIAVVGRIQTGSYTNKDGAKVYTTDVVVGKVEFADSKPEGAEAAVPDANGFETIPDGIDETLPFN